MNNNYCCNNIPKPCTSGCLEYISAKCVKYTGNYLTNLGINSGANLDYILNVIDTKIGSTGTLSRVYHNDSATIELTGLGTLTSPLVANFIGSTFDIQFTNSYFDI